MTKTFDFLFDFGSPASYLAWTQLPALEANTGATARLVPILLGGVFKATGNSSPITVPAKGKWMMGDLIRWAKRYGAPFNMNPHFPINTLMLMRGASGYLDDPRLRDYCDACFNGIWRDKLNMGDPAVVAKTLEAAGFPAAEVEAKMTAQEVKDRLKADTEAAVARGVFGAPTYFVGDQMFFGQDRQEFVAEALGHEVAGASG